MFHRATSGWTRQHPGGRAETPQLTRGRIAVLDRASEVCTDALPAGRAAEGPRLDRASRASLWRRLSRQNTLTHESRVFEREAADSRLSEALKHVVQHP